MDYLIVSDVKAFRQKDESNGTCKTYTSGKILWGKDNTSGVEGEQYFDKAQAENFKAYLDTKTDVFGVSVILPESKELTSDGIYDEIFFDNCPDLEDYWKKCTVYRPVVCTFISQPTYVY